MSARVYDLAVERARRRPGPQWRALATNANMALKVSSPFPGVTVVTTSGTASDRCEGLIHVYPSGFDQPCECGQNRGSA